MRRLFLLAQSRTARTLPGIIGSQRILERVKDRRRIEIDLACHPGLARHNQENAGEEAPNAPLNP
jgi:hypothetical protein